MMRGSLLFLSYFSYGRRTLDPLLCIVMVLFAVFAGFIYGFAELAVDFAKLTLF